MPSEEPPSSPPIRPSKLPSQAAHPICPSNPPSHATGFLRSDDTLVLFDFGLASRWALDGTESSADSLETRPLTGQTGSTRYMAPEVALSKPYNGKAEVYSFGILLWQMAAHDRPFRDVLSVAEFEYRVARNGERPRIPRWWPEGLKSLLRQCWLEDANARPSFGVVVKKLEELLASLGAGAANASQSRYVPSDASPLNEESRALRRASREHGRESPSVATHSHRADFSNATRTRRQPELAAIEDVDLRGL
jgi:serine/threonine protein kinase